MGWPHTSVPDDIFEVYHPDPKKLSVKDQQFWCLGKGCDYSLGYPQNLAYCLKHTAACGKVEDKFRQAASQYLGGNSASAKLETALKASELQLQAPLPNSPVEVDDQIVLKKTTMWIKLDFKNEGRKILTLCSCLAIVKLFCATALPPHIADHQEWKNMLMIANPAYHPASCLTIADSHIPKEAA
ncbi:hypothetical protein EDB19DRAFT_1831717 [Suillus lakei]|nr:hypothetical protein EDB19DRAFT_1831717 [Suillus lakei]